MKQFISLLCDMGIGIRWMILLLILFIVGLSRPRRSQNRADAMDSALGKGPEGPVG